MSLRPSRAVFAAAMIGLGIIGLVYGNSSEIWEPIPKSLPRRQIVIYVCSFVEVATGIGLLLRPSVVLTCRVLFVFLLLWLVLLKLPALFLPPHAMVKWESFGESAAMLGGAWCLSAAHAGAWEQRHLRFAVGERGIQAGRLLLIAALPMFGLAHFVYRDLTASLVPKWMSFAFGWTYFTGAASVVAAAGMLFGIVPRLAANMESAMLWIITLLVWVPRVVSVPNDQGNWAELFISLAIATSAWLVADTYRRVPWLASGTTARAISLD